MRQFRLIFTVSARSYVWSAGMKLTIPTQTPFDA
jgi:hypothetical protein